MLIQYHLQLYAHTFPQVYSLNSIYGFHKQTNKNSEAKLMSMRAIQPGQRPGQNPGSTVSDQNVEKLNKATCIQHFAECLAFSSQGLLSMIYLPSSQIGLPFVIPYFVDFFSSTQFIHLFHSPSCYIIYYSCVSLTCLSNSYHHSLSSSNKLLLSLSYLSQLEKPIHIVISLLSMKEK